MLGPAIDVPHIPHPTQADVDTWHGIYIEGGLWAMGYDCFYYYCYVRYVDRLAMSSHQLAGTFASRHPPYASTSANLCAACRHAALQRLYNENVSKYSRPTDFQGNPIQQQPLRLIA